MYIPEQTRQKQNMNTKDIKETYYIIHGYGTQVTVCSSLEKAKKEYLKVYNQSDNSIAIAKRIPVELTVTL